MLGYTGSRTVGRCGCGTVAPDGGGVGAGVEPVLTETARLLLDVLSPTRGDHGRWAGGDGEHDSGLR